jgi:two-component system NtrC family response regulator
MTEFFGHEHGAFTGATGKRRGLFEAADGGTLFLDEIAELSPEAQAALLRVLQEGAFRRVGGTDTVSTDVRIIAATHTDLGEAVRRGAFREDLYYRLNGMQIDVPSLRQRQDDIPILVRHFLDGLCNPTVERPIVLPPKLVRVLVGYPWPGNVRQLQNVLRHAAALSDGAVPRPDVVSECIRRVDISPVPASPSDHSPSSARATVLNLMRERGSVSRWECQKVLGCSASTAGRLLTGLVEEGVLQHEGKSRASRYSIAGQ